MGLMFDAFERWNDAQSGTRSEGNVETSVNTLVTLMKASGSDQRLDDIIKYTNDVCNLSLDVDGLYKS